MNMKKNLIIIVLLATIIAVNTAYADSQTITCVTAQQRYPWNGKVDISYTVTGDIAEEAKQRAVFTSLKVSAIDMVANTTNTATQLSGDLSLEEGTHAIVWDMDAEGLSFKSSNVVFKISCETTPATYCVIDLSAGASASSYPVTYLAEPPSGGFNVDEYKTTKLVLRRIEAGSFIMGDNQTDESHRVTLTEPFFCGIFEMTQKQYELVTGANPCSSTSYGRGNYGRGNTYPVHYVNYDTIRGSSDGANWPSSSAVDSTSFIGKLRARTSLGFDLPTEAQWEYACRAGTSMRYGYGGTENGNYMWYEGNSNSQSHPVGTKSANPWGLYDMHGNVWEWCLDRWGTLKYGKDPKGPSAEVGHRVYRGGSWRNSSDFCTSSYRGSYAPDDYTTYYTRVEGFRLVRTIAAIDAGDSIVLCYGQSAITAVDIASATRTATLAERIYYSSGWANSTGSGVTAVVAVNGEELISSSDSGYIDWAPLWNGTYTLTHKVMLYGEQIGETLTATFLVDGRDPTFSPQSGTIFEAALSISILCATEGATIHYTTDGSEPTVNSSVYRRFRINGRTTVKAIAEKDGLLSRVATAEYALGQCDDPVITPNDGAIFEWAGEQVSISWQGEDGVLRYTTDGCDPTRESPVYKGPFTISDSTIVKAKAFGDQFFDSAIVTANITRVWTDVAVPQIEAANSFTGSKTKVVISCATKGATIRYTLDGSAPNSNSDVYTVPIYVTDSCTVKAYAVKYDYRDSAVATQEIVKVWGIGDTMGKPDHGFTTDGSTGWMRVVDATAPNGEAMRSGAITHSQQSVLETKVMGPGTLTFSWRTSCEDSGGQYDWDHTEFAVDGTVLLWRDGINSWTNESVRINGNGEHTVTWTYKKDDVESDGDDAAYVAGYGWISDYTETQTTEVQVPYAWLLQHDSEIVDEFDAYEAAAKATAANGRNKVWECYVAGISPTNETAKFTAAIEMVDGVPQVTWSPNLNTNGIERTYTIWGKTNLTDGVEWECPTNSAHRFFKVTVELP